MDPRAAWKGMDTSWRHCKDKQSFLFPAGGVLATSLAIASPSKYLPVESRAGWDFHSLWKVLTSHWERGFGWFPPPPSGIVLPRPWIFSFLIFVLISDKYPMQQIFCPGAGFPLKMSGWDFSADPPSMGLEAAYAGGVDSANARSGHCQRSVAIMMWKMQTYLQLFPPQYHSYSKDGCCIYKLLLLIHRNTRFSSLYIFWEFFLAVMIYQLCSKVQNNS